MTGSAFPDTYPFGGVQVELNECFALLATANARVAPVLSKHRQILPRLESNAVFRICLDLLHI
jgi:hypothetical protein